MKKTYVRLRLIDRNICTNVCMLFGMCTVCVYTAECVEYVCLLGVLRMIFLVILVSALCIHNTYNFCFLQCGARARYFSSTNHMFYYVSRGSMNKSCLWMVRVRSNTYTLIFCKHYFFCFFSFHLSINEKKRKHCIHFSLSAEIMFWYLIFLFRILVLLFCCFVFNYFSTTLNFNNFCDIFIFSWIDH